MSMSDRIRRAILGPTDDEISAKSLNLGGPAYPIQPLPTDLPTELDLGASVRNGYSTPLPDQPTAGPRERFATGGPVPAKPATYNIEVLGPVIRAEDMYAAVRRNLDALNRHTPPGDVLAPLEHTPVPGTPGPINTDAIAAVGSHVPRVGAPYPIPDLERNTMTHPDDLNPPSHRGETSGDETPTRRPQPYPPRGTARTLDDLDVDLDVDIPLTDTGTHHTPATGTTGTRMACTTCEGRGYIVKTTNDLLRESLALLGPNNGGDNVIREFYRRLLTAAPDLATLFPPDLLNADTTHHQRDRLLSAITALADLYDPADLGKMARLETALRAFGRNHAAFTRPDGTIEGATPEEYIAVKTTLFGTIVDAAGEAWRPEYTRAWSKAYNDAMTIMLDEQRVAERNAYPAAPFPRTARQAER